MKSPYIFLRLTLSLCILSGCSTGTHTPDTPAESISPAEPEPEAEAEPAEPGVVFAKNGEARLSIVLPENAGQQVLYARDKLNLHLDTLLGITLESGIDSAHTCELLLGDTGRGVFLQRTHASKPCK